TPLVAICVATRRRPDGLSDLLKSLASQSERRFIVIVVEHDSESRVAERCHELADQLQLEIRYFLQSTGGIPQVRNRALDAVPEQIPWIAFIDDDEVAVEHWLSSLLEQAEKSNADIVLGPVVARYDESVAHWLRAG